MKRLFLAASLALSLVASPAAFANEEETPLEEKMSALNKSWRAIRRSIRDAANHPEVLKELEVVREMAKAAIEMTPARLEDVPPEQREAFMQGYRKEMNALLAHLDELEAAVKADKNDKAQEIIDRINEHRKESHKLYQREED